MPLYIHHIVSSGRQSVPVWGCMSAQGMGLLVGLEGRFRAHLYVDIIHDWLLPYILDGLSPEGASCASTTRALPMWQPWPSDNWRSVEFPSQSRSQYNGERLGHHEVPYVHKTESHTKLAGAVGSCGGRWWESLRRDSTLIGNLYASLPRRISAVIVRSGAPTRY